MDDTNREAEMTLKKRARAARRAASKVRKAQRQMVEAAWQEQVDTHFSYLCEQFGFAIGKVATTSVMFIGYVSEVGAVRVDRSHSLQTPGVEVYLTRHAVNGVFPPGRHWVLLDDLLRLRAPEHYAILQTTRGEAPEQIEQSLAFQAQVVREYASDVLRGDFSVFAEVETFLKSRGAE